MVLPEMNIDTLIVRVFTLLILTKTDTFSAVMANIVHHFPN